MFTFWKNLFKQKNNENNNELSLTVTINGQTVTTANKEEIAELLKQFSECLKNKN